MSDQDDRPPVRLKLVTEATRPKGSRREVGFGRQLLGLLAGVGLAAAVVALGFALFFLYLYGVMALTGDGP